MATPSEEAMPELLRATELATRKFLEEQEERHERTRHQRTIRNTAIASLGAAATLTAVFTGLNSIATNVARDTVESNEMVEILKTATGDALAETREAAKAAASLRGQVDTILRLQDEASDVIKVARAAAEAAKTQSDAAVNAASEAKTRAERAATEANSLVVEAQTYKEALAVADVLVKKLGESSQEIVDAALKSPGFQSLVAGKLTPPGIVVASTVACSALGAGWVDYADGAGRFIVGVGGGTDVNGNPQTFQVEEKAGEYLHKLTIDEMPEHTHGIVRSGDLTNDSYAAGRGTVPHSNTQNYPQTTAMGGNQPHNNIPPYIALFFCKKAS